MVVKAIRIEIQFENGATLWAEGDDAEKLIRWFERCQRIANLNGADFDGPKMKQK
jgi:hypothetical protein